MIYFFVFLILLGLCIPRINIIGLLSITYLGYLSLISINAADFSSYEGIYYSITSSKLYETGYGWYLINSWGRLHGLNYGQLKCVLTVIGLVLIAISIKILLKNNYNYIWGLYLLYPGLINIIQIRFFIALAISIFALIFLLNGKKWGIIVYFILILCAATIHTSVSFYLVFLLIPLIEKNTKTFSKLIMIVSILCIIFRKYLINILMLVGNQRQLTYLDYNYSVVSNLIMISVIIVFWLLSNTLNSIIQESKLFELHDKKVSKLIYSVNTCMLLLIPLIILSGELGRVQRISWILIYILIIQVSKYIKYINLFKVKVNIKFVGLLIGLFGFLVMTLYLAPAAYTSIFVN